MIRDAWAALTAGPDYPATEADRRTVTLAGLELPVRATVAIAVVTFALLFDYSRTFIPADLADLGRAPAATRASRSSGSCCSGSSRCWSSSSASATDRPATV